MESSLVEKDLRVLVDGETNVSQQCAHPSKKTQHHPGLYQQLCVQQE